MDRPGQEQDDAQNNDHAALLDRLREILLRHDLETLGQGKKLEQYTAEAGRLMLRLRHAETAADIKQALQQLFCMPASDPARLNSSIGKTANAIWAARQKSAAEPGSASQVQAQPQSHQRAAKGSTDKTVRQLLQESSRRYVDPAEFEAAREYERSLIPADAVLPQQGQCYRCSESLEVTVMLVFSMAGSASQAVTLEAGTEVIISELSDARPIVIRCQPSQGEAFAAQHITPSDRDNPNYSHFYLSVPTLEFLEKFEICD